MRYIGNQRNICLIPLFLKRLKERKRRKEREDISRGAFVVPGEIFENEKDHSFTPLLFYEEKMFNLKKLPGKFNVKIKNWKT